MVLSYGLILGVGVGMARDTSTLMVGQWIVMIMIMMMMSQVGQYFKKRRELVEIFLVSGSGLGIAAMSSWVRWVTREIGWRLGLQVSGQVLMASCESRLIA